MAAGATWATATPPGRIVGAACTTPGTVTLAIRPPPGWAGHVPGQHTSLTVPVGGARRTRCFSIASSPHRADGLVELTVKANGTGGVSDHLVRRAQPGDAVGLSPPAGEFVLPGERPPHVVLISAGSGITPVLSMLRSLVDEDFAGGGLVPALRPHPGRRHRRRRARRHRASPARLAHRRRPHRGGAPARPGVPAGPSDRPVGRFAPDHVLGPVARCGRRPGLGVRTRSASPRPSTPPGAPPDRAAPVHVERSTLGLEKSAEATGARIPLHRQRRRGPGRRPPAARPGRGLRPVARVRVPAGSATPTCAASRPAPSACPHRRRDRRARGARAAVCEVPKGDVEMDL